MYCIEKYRAERNITYLYLSLPILISCLTLKGNVLVIVSIYILLTNIQKELESYESFICSPIKISGAKKIKIIKRGWKNLIKDPSILFDSSKETLSLHFDMHHGYGNLDKAINLIDEKDKKEFFEYVNNSALGPSPSECILKSTELPEESFEFNLNVNLKFKINFKI